MLRKNVASQVVTFCLVNATTGAALSGATVTVVVSLDGTQSSGAGTVTSLGTGQYKYVPTQAETNGASVGFGFTASNAVPVNLQCFTLGQDPTLTTLDTNPIKWNGTAVASPATAGIPEVNVKNINNVATSSVTTINANVGTTQPTNFTGTAGSALVKSDMVDVAGAAVSTSTAQLGVNAVNLGGTAQTGRDIGASVLLSPGTGTGQLDFTSGVVKSNVVQFLGTALTETAGQIAAAFKKVFDVASPVFTATSVNQTGDSFARIGANGASLTSVGVGTGGIAAASFAANAIDSAALAASGANKVRDTILSDSTSFAGASIAAIKAKTDNLPEGIKKNTALNAFEFFMADSADHVTGKTGLTVAGAVSIDGGAFGALTNTPATEVGNGIYKINLASADLNGTTITLKFTSAGADATLIALKTTL